MKKERQLARNAARGLLALALACATITGVAAPASAATDTLNIDLSQSTGAFYGGATGTLYGFADAATPSAAIAAGLAPRTTAQKPQGGCQHSNGDIFDVAAAATEAGSKQLIIYMQDIYCNFPYEQPGIEDFKVKARAITEAVAARPDADQYAFVPFNEPDHIWYSDWSSAGQQRFYADWKTIVTEIRSIIPDALIIGPNEANYNANRIEGLLTYAKANGVLPDIMSWHELNPGSLANYRANYANYRAIETRVGIDPLEINIDEWANTRDLSVPGQLVQWITMFEDTKVDADMAYWTYAGNLNDAVSQTSLANAGWWLMKWYADLTGNTVRVTPSQPNTTDTLQGLATLDTARKQATALFGGTANPISVGVSGIDTPTFGTSVRVEVTKVSWAGYESNETAPQRISSQIVNVANGAISVALPAASPMDAYRLQVTPNETAPAVSVPWRASYEAESAQLQSAAAAEQNRLNPGYYEAMVYAQSGRYDVGGMNRANSAVTFAVDVPANGDYKLGVLYGTNLVPQQQALWIDGQYHSTLSYPATFSWLYKGRVDVPISLSAGAHSISIRTAGPSGMLSNSDATLDRIDLTQVTGPETAHYSARDARLTGTASLRSGTATTPAAALVSSAGSSRFFIAAADTGYYDLSALFTTTGASGLTLKVNNRTIATASQTAAGSWKSLTRVHLGAGISELTIAGTSTRSVEVTSVDIVRATAGDSSTQFVQAESAQLSGRAAVISDPLASGGSYVGYTGTENGEAGTVTVQRGVATGAGAYNLTLAYANDQRAGVRSEGVNRQFVASEAGGSTSKPLLYRNSYAWNNFWSLTQPVDLTTAGGAISIGNPNAAAPNVDSVALSRLVLSSVVSAQSSASPLDVAATASTRCVAGKVVVMVQVKNESNTGVAVKTTTEFGSKSVTSVQPGKSVSSTFSTRATSVSASSATVVASATIAGESVSVTEQAPYAAKSCG